MTRSQEGFIWTSSATRNGLETDSVIPSTPASQLKLFYDVIVIGAGFAGLIAARDLSRSHNLSVLLIEGRDRIGGRTWTARELGEEFEMGGTWVHWNQPHVYAELSRYNLHPRLKTTAGNIAAEHTFYKGRRPDGTTTATVQTIPPDTVAATAQRVADAFFSPGGQPSRYWMPYPHDPLRNTSSPSSYSTSSSSPSSSPAQQPWRTLDHLSVADRLAQLDSSSFSAEEKDVFETLVASFGSAPGAEIGFVEALRWYALGGHSMQGVFELAGVYKLGGGGMTGFAREVVGEFCGDKVFGAVVERVEQDAEEGVRVVVKVARERRRVFKAKQVVCTVPLNCLGDVAFSPPLSPLKQEAIRHGQINKGAKIHMRLGEVEPGWFAMASPSGDSPWCFAFSDHNGTGANGASGTYAIAFGYNDRIPDPTRPENSARIVQSFKENLRPQSRSGAEVTAYLTHPWHLDPLAKGVWSCWGKQAMNWADGWRGFIDGAIERGYRAVRDVLEMRKAENQGTKVYARL
ncbi:Monoamine oxidase N [Lasiodiplodia hormozganensis]|uniref:Amine oxidase n=1 Tax=Lasiodiplodia hormozganensis TaxID=869390 RepID=A0AA39YUW0_9PEZI|nr:Monoamine oxidase N [Lasiodiplodia hormozganensis]